MQISVKVLAGCMVALSATGCATVTRGPNTAFEVQTIPAGAVMSTSNGHQCPSTPCAVKMPRRSEFEVTLQKPGYKTVHASVTNKVAGAGAAGMAGNVILGGVIGAGVDVASGAMMDLSPNPLVVTLEPAGSSPVTAASRQAPGS